MTTRRRTTTIDGDPLLRSDGLEGGRCRQDSWRLSGETRSTRTSQYTPMRNDTALVTGASSGIGLELARLLAANGHPLVVVGQDAERLSAASAQLRSEYHVPVTCYARDLARVDGANELWADIVKANLRIDVLVNNAGIGTYGEFHHQPPDLIERMQILNVVALTTLTRLALPGMIERRHGRIMNVASMVAYQPAGPRMAVYYATKSYVLSFSKGIAAELAGTGVSV